MKISRYIIKSLKGITKKYPIVAVTGPRQSGKTTVLRDFFKEYRYVSLENPDNRDFAENDTKSFLKEYDKYVIFDEVQRVPKLFSYLQNIVDESGIMGQFVLSGSHNFHLMQNIKQTLAGRVAILKLFPFDIQEMKVGNLLDDDIFNNLITGFYPAIYDRDIPAKVFYSNYIQTYIYRDITELLNIRQLQTFKNFLSVCATQAGQLLNINSLAKECGISQPTAKSWLSILEQSFITFQIYPFHKNFKKRIVKTPKLYFYDTGLLSFLLKIRNKDQIINKPIKGALFENMMIAEYVKRMYHTDNLQDIWFWRDSAGHEVDLLVRSDNVLNAIEFKSTTTIMTSLFKGLEYFYNIAKNEDIPISKTLVYAGDKAQKRSEIDIVDWQSFGKETYE